MSDLTLLGETKRERNVVSKIHMVQLNPSISQQSQQRHQRLDQHRAEFFGCTFAELLPALHVLAMQQAERQGCWRAAQSCCVGLTCALLGQYRQRIHFETAEPNHVASGPICNSPVRYDMTGARALPAEGICARVIVQAE